MLYGHATQMNLPAVLRGGPYQGVYQGGFTRAIAPEQGQGLALVQSQINVMQHHGFTVTGAQLVNAKQFSHGLFPSTPL
jgi:hypothetical protein